MTADRQRILITGAAGSVGTTLRRGLSPHVSCLRLADISAMTPEAANEECLTLDLRDEAATSVAIRNVDAVIHLGAIPTEAPFQDLVESNVHGTHNVLEACRRNGVPRVIFASSHHATGFYPRGERLDGAVFARPDSYYGVTKVLGESLARLYHDKFGLQVICVRIGSFAESPTDRRMLSTWLSPTDCLHLFRRCLAATDVGFAVIYGASANTRSWWSNDPAAAAIGYRPQDDAERFASELDNDSEELLGRRAQDYQGGAFVDVHGTRPVTRPAPARREDQ